ncbi:MAG: tetratricopeptide repeat protein [Pantanalinema sp. GBBB05]|nr:tetratricopeptide repeat protein [Pantanalinema sp. GBBB05]
MIGIKASGGYGKTFLAAKLWEQAELSGGQKLWISFNQPYTFGNFGRWLLQQLGQSVDEALSDEDLLLIMVESLSRHPCLLVMDNLETLLQADGEWQEAAYGAFFRRWLSHGRSSTMLLTSREQFALPNNWREKWRWYPLAGLQTEAGIALLKGKGIRGAEADLAQFVELVDGHPLSLSLTAGWLIDPQKNVAPDVTFALTQDDWERFEHIVGDHRGDPEASVGRILAASVERLPINLKTLWLALSVYRLSFDLAAAQAMRATVTLDDLWILTRRSLLEEQPIQDAPTLAEKWRFQFSSLLQRFAQQQASDLTAAHQNAIAYYLFHLKPKPWGQLADLTNHLEVFHHWCELHQYHQAFDTISVCDDFLDLQGYNRIRLELYSRLVLAWQQQAWQIEPSEDLKPLLASILRLGNAHLSLAQYPLAIRVNHLLRELTHQTTNRFYEGAALGNLGAAYLSQGDYDQAISYSQQQLTIAQTIGDRASEGKALGNLGLAYLYQGDYDQAISYSQQWLTIAQTIGDRASEGKALGNLGLAYLSQGDYDQAISYLQQLLTIAQAIGDRASEGSARGNLGAAYLSQGDYDQAISYLQQQLTIAQTIGDRASEGKALGNLGAAYLSQGDYDQAISYSQQQLTIARTIGDRASEGKALGNLGLAYLSQGDYDQAISYSQQQLTIARTIGDRHSEANAWFYLGETQEKRKSPAQAIEFYTYARSLYQQMGLEKDVQDCEQKIQQLSIRSRNCFSRFASGLLRTLYRAWRWFKNHIR